MAAVMSKQQKEWQKESDADTLATAEQIRNDPARMKGAQEAAAKLVKDSEARAKAMKKVVVQRAPTKKK